MWAMNERLLIMQKFLTVIGLESELCGGKLYIIDVEDKHCEIVEKSEELGLTYVMEQEPVYSPINPRTLHKDISGFRRLYYLEVRT